MSFETQTPPSGPSISKWGALARVVTDPVGTFQALGSQPAILPGYLTQMLVSLAFTAALMPKLLAMLEAQFQATPGLPAEAVAIGKVTGVISGVFGAIAAPWIAGVFTALFAMFFGQFQEGGSRGFTAYFGMAGYARVPLILSSAVTSLLTFFATSMTDFQSITQNFSLAILLGSDASPILRALLATINPFGVWYYIVLAIGFATVHRAKPAKGAAFALTLYLIGTLLAVGSAAIGQVFTPNL